MTKKRIRRPRRPLRPSSAAKGPGGRIRLSQGPGKATTQGSGERHEGTDFVGRPDVTSEQWTQARHIWYKQGWSVVSGGVGFQAFPPGASRHSGSFCLLTDAKSWVDRQIVKERNT